MGNALRHVRGESQKNIVRFIEGLSGKYSRWDIWQDFIIMSAIAIANTMGGPQAKAREEMYRSRAEKYSAKELEVFADMLLEVVAELERDPEQDFLGELFMALGLGNEWKGQFFTRGECETVTTLHGHMFLFGSAAGNQCSSHGYG